MTENRDFQQRVPVAQQKRRKNRLGMSLWTNANNFKFK